MIKLIRSYRHVQELSLFIRSMAIHLSHSKQHIQLLQIQTYDEIYLIPIMVNFSLLNIAVLWLLKKHAILHLVILLYILIYTVDCFI